MIGAGKDKKAGGFKVVIKKDKCKSCGLCLLYCPAKCLIFSKNFNKKGVKFAKKKKDENCLGCGNCFLICPDACVEIYEG